MVHIPFFHPDLDLILKWVHTVLRTILTLFWPGSGIWTLFWPGIWTFGHYLDLILRWVNMPGRPDFRLCTRILGAPLASTMYSHVPVRNPTDALHGSRRAAPTPPVTATAVDGAAGDATPGGGAEAVSLSNSTDLTSS